MKYTIGYQLPDQHDSVAEICRDYDKNISGVYFSWANEKSGRLPLSSSRGDEPELVKQTQLQDLKEIKRMGKRLTLLLNANCYGEEAASKAFGDRILSVCDFLKKQLDLDSVTTTSPFLAEMIKLNFKDDLQVIASVNMRVGTIKAMEQLSSYFDGFYMAKECNRDFEKLRKLHKWCKDHGKKLAMLANSGCMPYCGFQTFHDNMVAHQSVENVFASDWKGLPSPCHRYLRSMDALDGLSCFMQGTWIRPEDIPAYEPYFEEVKIATRMHARMRMVIGAYARGRYMGNLLDLTEPSYSHDFKGYVLDPTRLPQDFFDKVTVCNKECHDCGYCKQVVKDISVKYLYGNI